MLFFLACLFYIIVFGGYLLKKLQVLKQENIYTYVVIGIHKMHLSLWQ